MNLHVFQIMILSTFCSIGLCIVATILLAVETETNWIGRKMRADVGAQNLFDDASTVQYNDAEIRALTKRSVSGAAKGIAAAEAILSGARKYRTTKTARFWKKTGNLRTAIADFNSVQPVLDTRKPYSVYWKQSLNRKANVIGTIGDRRFILIPNGDPKSKFKPVVEIRTPADTLYDRIIYTTE